MKAHFIFCNRTNQLKKIKRACMQPYSDSASIHTNTTDRAFNVNLFYKHLCKLGTTQLRGNSRAAGNIRLKEILKRMTLFGNPTVVLLTNSVALTNIGASNPFFFKLL